MNFIPRTLLFGLIVLAEAAAVIFLFVLLVRALLKYLRSGEVRKEKAETKRSLGEALKAHRTRCKMTQEFVAETIGVSRQAVSKWESGTSDPSTSQSSTASPQKTCCGKRRGNEHLQCLPL